MMQISENALMPGMASERITEALAATGYKLAQEFNKVRRKAHADEDQEAAHRLWLESQLRGFGTDIYTTTGIVVGIMRLELLLTFTA